jgi:hypothetical protein
MAGYAELATVLRTTGEKRDSFSDGHRAVMGSLDAWKYLEPASLDRLRSWQTQKVMPAVAEFLERLVKIIECRGP